MARDDDAYLGDSIADVQNNAHGQTAMSTYSNPIKGWRNWPGGKAALHGTEGTIPKVSEMNAKRLLTVLAFRKTHSNAALFNNALGDTTVKQFREMSHIEQINYINGLWNAATSSHPFLTKAEDMYDPAGNKPTSGTAPIPTSWQPNDTKRLSGKPWQKFTVGFRVDGSDDSSIDRVKTNGMTQQRLALPFMRGRRGMEITETAAANTASARCWTANNDIFNETAVCVSRNFFGATAFPERTTIHTKGQACYLWAVDCSGLLGFDTEQYQINLPGSRNWRPGEKAFQAIPPERLIGYIPVRRHGCPGQGWSFSIDSTTSWTLIHKVGDLRKREYINGELDAWKGRKHNIPGTHDFANA